MVIKKIFLFVLLLFSITFVSAYNLELIHSGNKVQFESYYCNPNNSACSALGVKINGPTGLLNYFTDNYDVGLSSPTYKRIFFYNSNVRLSSIKFSNVGSGGYSKSLTPQQGYRPTQDLNGQKCDASVSFVEIDDFPITDGGKILRFNYHSNLNKFNVVAPENLLRDYYYMKTNFKRKIVRPDGTDFILANNLFFPDKTKLGSDGSFYFPVDQTGEYKVFVKTDTSVEPKCADIGSVTSVWDEIDSFEVYADEDLDGVFDEFDNCPDVYGLPEFKGCPTEYTLGGDCTDSDVKFNGDDLVCDYDDTWGIFKKNYFKFNGKTVSPNEKNLYYTPKQGGGTYKCYNDELIWEKFIGSCTLMHNADNPCSNDKITLASGTKAPMYKYMNTLPTESPSLTSSDVTCGTNGEFNYDFDWNTYKFPFTNYLGDAYADLVRLPGNYITKEDDANLGKLSCSDDFSSCKTNFGGIDEIVDLSVSNFNVNKSIQIYKNGVLDRNESINPVLIGLNAHSIRNFKSGSEIKNFINNSYNVMNKFDIVKNLTYSGGKTRVRIQLDNIPVDEQRNLVIYQILPKSVAANLRNINVINNGGGEFFVLDKDPVIGWYFNDSDFNTSIEYETDGSTEGGAIIISQEAILFNQGDLVVKYREVGCNADEVNLFELDSLVESKIHNSGSSKLFKVCLSHLDDSVNLLLNSGTNNFDLFSYANGGDSSINMTKFSNVVNVGVDNDTIFWSMVISEENPDGDYSCVGSFTTTLGDSTFGDCGNNDSNRLWIHLGEDITAPVSTLSNEIISHIIPISITAVDDIAGSGVLGIYYCIDDDDSCNPIADGDYVFGDFANLSVTCPDRWGCIKYVRISAIDNSDNYEEVNSQPIKIIDVGSSCQSDCTVKPSPNRYIKECNNLNSCDYFNFDKLGIYDNGVYVSNICDFGVEGSHAKFNSTHDIKCPAGPFRPTMYFGDLVIDSECENLRTFDYPTIIEGESINMKVLVCAD